MTHDPVERITFGASGVELVADAAGPVEGSTLLFLHGGGQTRKSWGAAILETARRGYRAVSVDLRGHGESGWASDGRYDLDAFVEDIREVVACLRDPSVIIGASLGGVVGLLLASDSDAKLKALVLVDVVARGEQAGMKEIGNFMQSAPNGFASIDEAADAVAAYLPHRPRPKDTSGLLRNLRLRHDGRYVWHWDPAFLSLGTRGKPDPDRLEAAARKLRLPTLLIRGGRSRVVSAEGARAFLKIVPHAEFVDVAGADHMVAGDDNDAFNDAVFSFLGKHAPVDRGAACSSTR
jgi:pimeloyl-ACP methyl ester carboxylesterase